MSDTQSKTTDYQMVDRKSQLDVTESAIRCIQEQVGIVQPDYPARMGLLNKLGSFQRDRYDITKELKDLNETIQTFQEAANARSLNPSDRPRILSYLGVCHRDKFKRTGKTEDLEHAIFTCQEAADTSSSEHPNRTGILSNLGIMFSEKYNTTGDIQDLEYAIKFIQEAIETNSPSQSERSGLYTNLAIMFHYKYNMTQALVDLDEAVSNCRKDIMDGPADQINQATGLTHLSVMLGYRYNRVGSCEDLKEAIAASRKAVETIPPHHENRAVCLNNLGLRLGEWYDRTKDVKDLEEAISKLREAIQATLCDHADYARWMNNLGMRLFERYRATGASNDLDDAVSHIQTAVDATPLESPDRTGLLNNLGKKLLVKHEQTKFLEDRRSALAAFETAVKTEHGHPMERINAARNLGNVFIDCARWSEAVSTFSSAFDVLQTLNPQSLPRTDQQWILSELSGLSSDSASAALEDGRPASEALQLLETCRCIIAGFAIDSRSDVRDLKAADPSLCDEYEKCRENISQYGMNPRMSSSNGNESKKVSLQQLLRDLANIEAKIRQIPNFERFKLPLEPKDFMDLAKGGPIVTINVSKIRSDAIIVNSNRIWAIDLPHLKQNTLEKKVEPFSAVGTMLHRHGSVRMEKNSLEEELQENLLWLWNVIVLPVLNALAEDNFQRIWWVAGGIMGRVPFHAAGKHTKGSLENTISRVVSSYTSTFKALQYARQNPQPNTLGGNMLLVNIPETPGYDKLNTRHEATILDELFDSRIIHLKHPGKAIVLDKLTDCTFAHFACHALSNPEDPSKSGLLLVESGKPEILTVSELDEVNLESAEIAYLSACSTAELPDGKLTDEAIHLSNSFQMIGFRHVIGTMWAAHDYAAGEISKMFYRALISESQGEVSGELQVARALHNAVVEFRERSNDIAKWGAFIHIGV